MVLANVKSTSSILLALAWMNARTIMPLLAALNARALARVRARARVQRSVPEEAAKIWLSGGLGTLLNNRDSTKKIGRTHF